MIRSLYVALPLLAFLTILQATVLGPLPGLGIAPQMVLVTCIAWALVRGPYEGLIWAFLGGLFLDLFSLAPLGTTSLALMISVLVMMRLREGFPENRYIVPVMLAGIALAIHSLVSSLLLWPSGYRFDWQVVGRLLPAYALNGLLVFPTYWLLYYVDRALYPPPVAT